jgi:hypothetical protein
VTEQRNVPNRTKENAMKTKSQIKAGAESVGLPNRKGYIK